MAVRGFEFVDNLSLITKNYGIWRGQRSRNDAWVAQMKQDQISYITQFGLVCFPGNIILIKHNNVCYVADGQHRIEVMRQLWNDGYQILIHLCVETYDCGANDALADKIYLFANERYKPNSGVDLINQQRTNESPSIVLPTIVSIPKTPVQVQWMNNLRLITNDIGTTFKLQQSPNEHCSAPSFCVGTLEKELISSGVIQRLDPNIIITRIKQVNSEYKQILFTANRDQYDKCRSGFYLPYYPKVGAKCRWVKEIFKDV